MRRVHLRDRLIQHAMDGKITPDEAEARAKRAGLSSLAVEPEFERFDPIKESRWTMPMAISWIAWRDLRLVAQQREDFCKEATFWAFREVNEPINGSQVKKRDGWFLETWHKPTTILLSFCDSYMRSTNDLPKTVQMTPGEAEKALWRALTEERLKAEGFDRTKTLVEIPSGEWPHLKLFAVGERDVLRYEALDLNEPYTNVRFRRDDLCKLWQPVYVTVDTDRIDLGDITDAHMAPMQTGASHVPLSSAICWIMTDSGVSLVGIRNEVGWQEAVRMLFSKISEGWVETIGRDNEQMSCRIDGVTFASVRVPSPVNTSIEYLLGDCPTHVRCHLFTGIADWEGSYNDQFFAGRASQPRWTHLQVRRSHVLKHWPKPAPKAKAEANCRRWLADLMRESPLQRPKPKAEFKADSLRRFPALGLRGFERAWADAAREAGVKSWLKPGRPSEKSNHRSR